MSPWSYIRFCIVATLTAFAGAQTVHYYYRPLKNLEEIVQEELKRRQELIHLSETK